MMDYGRVRELIVKDEAYATTLLMVAADIYGTDDPDDLSWLEWEPETHQISLERALRVPIQPTIFDRLMVAIALKTTDRFYTHLPTFIDFCNVLSGDVFDPQVFDPADSREIAWGVLESALIEPLPEGVENPFSEEILAYMGKVLDSEGLVDVPRSVSIAIRDSDVPLQVQTTFGNDPGMMETIMQTAALEAETIDQEVTEQLRRLLTQVDSLGIKTKTGRRPSEGLLRVLQGQE